MSVRSKLRPRPAPYVVRVFAGDAYYDGPYAGRRTAGAMRELARQVGAELAPARVATVTLVSRATRRVLVSSDVVVGRA